MWAWCLVSVWVDINSCRTSERPREMFKGAFGCAKMILNSLKKIVGWRLQMF